MILGTGVFDATPGSPVTADMTRAVALTLPAGACYRGVGAGLGRSGPASSWETPVRRGAGEGGGAWRRGAEWQEWTASR